MPNVYRSEAAGAGLRVGIVVARWNSLVTGRLLEGALAALAHRAGGLSLDRAIVGTYRGWTIRFHRDPAQGTLTITAEPAPPQTGQPAHPEPPQAQG